MGSLGFVGSAVSSDVEKLKSVALASSLLPRKRQVSGSNRKILKLMKYLKQVAPMFTDAVAALLHRECKN